MEKNFWLRSGEPLSASDFSVNSDFINDDGQITVAILKPGEIYLQKLRI